MALRSIYALLEVVTPTSTYCTVTTSTDQSSLSSRQGLFSQDLPTPSPAVARKYLLVTTLLFPPREHRVACIILAVPYQYASWRMASTLETGSYIPSYFVRSCLSSRTRRHIKGSPGGLRVSNARRIRGSLPALTLARQLRQELGRSEGFALAPKLKDALLQYPDTGQAQASLQLERQLCPV
jgi:hypothetical protein